MDIITILFITEDLAYAKALSRCVTEVNKAMVFTVLTQGEWESKGSFQDHQLMLLDYMEPEMEGDWIHLKETEGEDELFRYDTAENLAAHLAALYGVKTGRTLPPSVKGPAKLVFFCGACGGTGKTSVALGLGEELSRFHGKKVLYLSWEEVESTGVYFQEDERKRLDNYLYGLTKDPSSPLPLTGAALSSRYGVMAFSPSPGRNPLKELTREEWTVFLEKVQQSDPLDYIFLDGDGSLNETAVWLASACHQICQVSRPGLEDRQKRYDRYLEHWTGTQVWEKVIRVINFAQEPLPDGKAEGEWEPETRERSERDSWPKTVYVDRDDSSFVQGKRLDDSLFIAISVERDFGSGIKRLSSELT